MRTSDDGINLAEKVSGQISKNGHGGARSNSGGRREGAGRRKGVPNKISGDVKAMILEALEGKGGVEYLMRQADANPTAFMSLIGKVLPMTVVGDPNQPLETVTRIELVSPAHRSN